MAETIIEPRLRYGDSVIIKEGFYEDIEGIVVDWDPLTKRYMVDLAVPKTKFVWVKAEILEEEK